jgi:putative ABC transport system permease protein
VGSLIVGESLMMTALGGAAGILLTFPTARAFKAMVGTLFPVFNVAPQTVLMQVLAAVAVGLAAGVLPSVRAGRVKIVEGLRYIG